MMSSPSLLLIPVLLSATTAAALAADTMRMACAAEIQKYKCEALSESYAYDCLKKNHEARTRNKGFSRSCFKAYTAFEKTAGRSEKVDSHEVENPEHSR